MPVTTTVYDMRRCTNTLLDLHIPDMIGKWVLEVGFGWTNDCEKMLRDKPGTEWLGIDPRWRIPEGSSKCKFQMSVDKMGFPDGHFDVVYASQTMEHWGEPWGVHKDTTATPDAGLAEISRVMKQGGVLLVDVPILSHGSRMFKSGDLDGIRNMFSGSVWHDVWHDVVLEPWGRDCSPLLRNRRHNKEYVLAIRAVRK